MQSVELEQAMSKVLADTKHCLYLHVWYILMCIDTFIQMYLKYLTCTKILVQEKKNMFNMLLTTNQYKTAGIIK